MKKIITLLFALLLSTAASAQTNIRVSVTYSPKAANTAGGVTAIRQKISDAIGRANTRYANSGINITLEGMVAFTAAKSAPSDTSNSDLKSEYAWAEHSVESWLGRCGGLPAGCPDGASISIHVTDNNTASVLPRYASDLPTGTGWTAAAAVPLNGIEDNQGAWLEYAISHIIGSGTGYSARARTPTIGPYSYSNGAAMCWHTFETAPGNILPSSTVIPYLSWWAMPGLGVGDDNVNETCAAYYTWFRSPPYGPGRVPGGTYTQPTNYSVTGNNGSTAICNMLGSGGSVIYSEQMSYSPNTPRTGETMTVSCTETTVNLYSKAPPATAPFTPSGYPMGQTGLDSVSSMNGRASTVAAFVSSNGTNLQKALGMENYIQRFRRTLGM